MTAARSASTPPRTSARSARTPEAWDEHAPVFVISVAAELSGMHPQTLRQYDRIGLVSPRRTPGRGRRYSPRDVQKLRQVQQLSQEEGINLAGIKRILELEDEVREMHERLAGIQQQIEASTLPAAARRIFAADAQGHVTPLPRGRRPERQTRREAGALVLYRPGGRS